jgi:hypothetical protein
VWADTWFRNGHDYSRVSGAKESPDSDRAAKLELGHMNIHAQTLTMLVHAYPWAARNQLRMRGIRFWQAGSVPKQAVESTGAMLSLSRGDGGCVLGFMGFQTRS